MASVFRGTIEFFGKLGIYDVILPFLLVYAVMYAVLEKTKVLGADKKSINAVVSFTTAFFIVASTKLVAVISQGIANVMLVIMMIFSFLLLASMFFVGKDKDGKPIEFSLSPGMRTAAVIVTLVVVLAIFLYYLGWLMPMISFIANYWNTEAVSAIIFMGVMIGLIAWMTGSTKSTGDKKEEKKN